MGALYRDCGRGAIAAAVRKETVAGDERISMHQVCPHDCYDTCGLTVEQEHGRIVRIAGEKGHPITQGFACLKVNRYLERLNHPGRIVHPLRRTGPKGSGQFAQASWADALADIGGKLQDILRAHGGEAVLPYSFSGNMGVLSEASMDRRFFHALGASRLARTICTASADHALRWVYGMGLGPDPETIPEAGMVILWGSNPAVTNIHEVPLLDKAVRQGAEIVVIDPLGTETADRYGGHLAINPGSDAALALGIGRHLVESGQYDADFVRLYARGFEHYRQRAWPWTLERTAEATGIPGRAIEHLAQGMARRAPLLLRTGYGVQRQVHSGESVWAISVLSVLTGSHRHPGGGHLLGNGGAFPLNWDRLTRPDLLVSSPRTINMLQLGNALNQEGSQPVRALVVYNSNPAATAPDQGQVLAGLMREDLLTVVHEQMMTDTACYADWVLPAAMAFETLDLHTSYWHRYIQLSEKAVEPPGEAVSNTEFFRRLARASGFSGASWCEDSDEELVRQALDTDHPWLQGITLGTLQREPVQKVRIDSRARPFLDVARSSERPFCLDPLPVPEYFPVPAPAEYPWALITPARKNTIKSSFGNIPGLLSREPEPAIYMHQGDADRLGVRPGDMVRVESPEGFVEMRLWVSARARPGVAVSYAVRWNSDGGGRNVNQLTSQSLSDVGGGSTFYSTWVSITGMESGED